MTLIPRSSRGFTLIEMLIVVALVGILAAIAYPSYQEQIRKSRRAEAKSTLLQLAMVMERVFTENNTYLVDDIDPCVQGPPTCANPIFGNKSPIDGTDDFYRLTIVDGPDGDDEIDDDYSLEAAPLGDQAPDKCGTLTLNNLGQKSVKDADLDADYCW